MYLLLLFKTHLSEIFLFQLAWPKEPTWALDLPSKIFSILLLNSLRCSYLRWFHVFCENTQFIPHMLSIHIVSFYIFSIPYMLNFIQLTPRTCTVNIYLKIYVIPYMLFYSMYFNMGAVSFRTFSIYVKFPEECGRKKKL